MAQKPASLRKGRSPVQLDLFPAAPIAAEPTQVLVSSGGENTPSVDVQDKPVLSWIARHWPDYSSSAARRPMPSSLQNWAASLDQLPRASRALLLTLARELDEQGRCRISLTALWAANGMGRSTCRRHLDKLMAAGLVLMKPWCDPAIRGRVFLGYEFRLVVDDQRHAAALTDGFCSRRHDVRLATGPVDD